MYLNGWFNNRSEEPVPAHTRIPSSAFRAAWAAFCAPLAAAPDGEDDAKSPRKIVTDHWMIQLDDPWWSNIFKKVQCLEVWISVQYFYF